MSCVITC